MDRAPVLFLMFTVVINSLDAQIPKSADYDSCIDSNGKLYNLYDKMVTVSFWYQCQPSPEGDGNYPYFRRMGCVGPSGGYLSNGDIYEAEGFIYECQVTSGGVVRSRIIRCINYNGAQIENGEVYIRDNYAYLCDITADGRVRKRIVGCATPDFERMSNGDIYISGAYYFECDMKDNGDWQLEVAGCVDERRNMVRVGESWLRPSGSEYQYRNYCNKDNDGVSIIVTACHYKTDQDHIEIKPNCYQPLLNGEEYFTCRQKDKNSPTFIGFAKTLDEVNDLNTGDSCFSSQ